MLAVPLSLVKMTTARFLLTLCLIDATYGSSGFRIWKGGFNVICSVNNFTPSTFEILLYASLLILEFQMHFGSEIGICKDCISFYLELTEINP